ncbi:MAG: endonuclease/exonuclease/phosphatase family protein [Burkholderiales bacterium]
MIGRIEVFLRRLRRLASRSEWLAALLRLPPSVGTEAGPGLLLVQIDGLSHAQLQRALAHGEMPFLNHLLNREHYRLHTLYAGVPSTTGAFQGELYYGVKRAVPAFSFLDSASGAIIRLTDAIPTARIEHDLALRGGTPLLEGGSAYVNIFSGGAAESHFCSASRGWGPSLRQARSWVVLLLITANAYSFVRVGLLFLWEIVLAIYDCIRGVIQGEKLTLELKFVPTRVAISVLLRELATIGAKIDLARGLPVVQINFLGYDEQAHRRGPASAFAHWTLKGIDDAIARLWRAGHRSARRAYDLWIYSDHGQEEALPYRDRFGQDFAQAVKEAFSRLDGVRPPDLSATANSEQTTRVRWLGGKCIQRLFAVQQTPESPDCTPLAVALGPIGLVYTGALPHSDKLKLARSFVSDARFPLVLMAEGDVQARAWTAQGEFLLPAQAAEVLGSEHPFLEEAARDLALLCHDPDSGDLLVSGWCAGMPVYTFAAERGAHGGFGPNETSAFALLPADTPLPAMPYARPNDLRQAGLRALQRIVPSRKTGARATPRTLRIMTYNVHSCIGMDGKLSPERIARVIARYSPDVVALQELDVGRTRSDGVDQAHVIARHLAMDFHFHPALHLEEERYGDAILTHLPMRLIRAGALPTSGLAAEPRGALWAAIEIDGREIQIINTHLGLMRHERRIQTDALLGADWLSHPECKDSVVLCGDLNALPSSSVCRRLSSRLKDAQTFLQGHRPRQTFSGRFPAARIDHIFVDPRMDVLDIEVPGTELTRVASDHLPLIAEVQLPRH